MAQYLSLLHEGMLDIVLLLGWNEKRGYIWKSKYKNLFSIWISVTTNPSAVGVSQFRSSVNWISGNCVRQLTGKLEISTEGQIKTKLKGQPNLGFTGGLTSIMPRTLTNSLNLNPYQTTQISMQIHLKKEITKYLPRSISLPLVYFNQEMRFIRQ